MYLPSSLSLSLGRYGASLSGEEAADSESSPLVRAFLKRRFIIGRLINPTKVQRSVITIVFNFSTDLTLNKFGFRDIRSLYNSN